ncbi:universal stress protein [Dinoroseobacter sp. S375]|uniref:universal stress protein n=1 Tax=Dinoroseobacter sp. S375 TaxID=3415136 RepID=UPI003C79D336
MSLRNILVAFNGTESAVSALQYAAGIARGHGAHVTALLAYATHDALNSHAAWVPREATRIIADASAEFLDGIEAQFEALRPGLELGDRLQFRRVPGRVDTVLSDCAQVHDVLVVGQDQSAETDSHVSIHNDRIALMSGRPVLVIPKGCAERQSGHSVLAWDGGRAAARAMADALDMLTGQTRIDVLTVGNPSLARPIDEVLQHLSRHGIEASHAERAVEKSIAETILAYCRKHKPGTLVMGAYEHSKFREDFFGGVTARILVDAPIPILLSH